ncbi:hypothetical protein F8388_022638 [Cannabis sativa]|uniref:Myb/SANT-like domain-containing protein n=1 Tax=Cannabis sativa TaxID=3483 RepID=A0A7J6G2B0_CANSA|nr:hypothetical protein F8388_022638 [Cannabis sativa]
MVILDCPFLGSMGFRYHSTTSLFLTLLKFSISPYLVMKTDEQMGLDWISLCLNRIKEELYAQAKRSYTDTQLRNKCNLLRQKHKDFKSLLKETSIGFSVVTGQVTAPDEVWDRLIRVNKSAKKI